MRTTIVCTGLLLSASIVGAAFIVAQAIDRAPASALALVAGAMAPRTVSLPSRGLDDVTVTKTQDGTVEVRGPIRR